MTSLTAVMPRLAVSAERPQDVTETHSGARIGLKRSQLALPSLQGQRCQTGKPIILTNQSRGRAVICASALTARCGAEQTQTVTRESSTITIAPVQGKEKSPDLDDGGTGLPPRDDGDGGGGGGGGGGNWSGGFFFFGFLAFLGFLKDSENEAGYKEDRRRY